MILPYIVVPGVIWLGLKLTLRDQRWEFDFDIAHTTFSLLLGKFLAVAATVAVSAVAVAVLSRVGGAPVYGQRSALASAVYALLFAVWLLCSYESYLHAKYPRTGRNGESSYTTSKYALTISLAISSLVYLLVGIAGMSAIL